jgi:hypothetical protein
MNDPRTLALIVGVLALLAIVTAVGQFLRRHPDRGSTRQPSVHSTAASVAGGSCARCSRPPSGWDHRHGGAVWPGFILGPAGVHHPDAHASGRPPRPVLGVLCVYPRPLRAGGLRPLRRFQRVSPALRHAVCIGSRGDRRRFQTLPGTHGKDPGRPDGLRLLPLVCRRSAAAARADGSSNGGRSGCCRACDLSHGQLPPAVLPDPAGAVCRLHAVRLEPHDRPPTGGRIGQFQPHLGRSPRECREHLPARLSALVGRTALINLGRQPSLAL